MTISRLKAQVQTKYVLSETVAFEFLFSPG